MTENGMEREWRRELQVMLMLNVKAEMELLDEREGGLEDWVEDSLLARMGGGKQRANDDDDVVMENGLC